MAGAEHGLCEFEEDELDSLDVCIVRVGYVATECSLSGEWDTINID